MKDRKAAEQVYEAIHEALRGSQKTVDPMNALVVWTELGKGLAGKLERQGADAGMLERLTTAYCRREGGDTHVELSRWAYHLAPDERLTREEVAAALGRVQRAIEERLMPTSADNGPERQKEWFLATVRGWFPVGLAIVRSLPACRGAGEQAAHAALGAWCARYLTRDTSGPGDLGVRSEKRAVT